MPPPTMQPVPAGLVPDGLLERNLQALERVDPALAERLRWPVDGSKVELAADGSAHYRLHKSRVRLDVVDPAAFARAALREADARAGVLPERAASPVLLFGVGTGELLGPLVSLGASGRRVLAWDADPWHLRLALARHDLARPLAERRLVLLLGTDLLDVELEGLALVRHPLLAELHRDALAIARAGARGPRAVVASGGLFVDEVRAALARRGWSTWTLDVGGLSREELARSLERLRPRILFTVNHTEGLAEFCAERDVTPIVWEVDPSLAPPRRLAALASETHQPRIFTYRERNARAFRAAGYARVAAMPLAADPELRCPLELSSEERERWGAPVAFVGSSLVANARALRAQALTRWSAWLGGGERAAEQAAAGFKRVIEAQRATPERDRIAELLESEAPGLVAAMAEAGIDLPVFVGETAAAEKRLSTLASLGTLGLSVWGDEGWSALTPHGVRWRGQAGHREELTRIYNAALVHVDVARLYQSDIVPMRVFDILACGGFLIAEHSAELASLFTPGRELESWRTPAELRAKVAHYLAHPADARTIAERGRAAVLERHTIDQRLERMLAGIEQGTTPL